MSSSESILFIGGNRTDSKLLQEILSGRDLPVSITVRRVSDHGEIQRALAEECRYLLQIIDVRCDWQDLLPRIVETSAIAVLFGSNLSEDQADQALSLGATALFPADSGGLLGVARLAGELAGRSTPDTQAPSSGQGPQPAGQDGLIYAISHDFQAPLQLAHRYAKVLDEDYRSGVDEDAGRIVDHLLVNLGRTQQMLDELLDYSRLQSEALMPEDVDLGKLLDETLDLYRLDLDEASAQVIAEPLPVAHVDPRQFLRLFQNLIGNSIKFRSDAPLRIWITLKQTADEWCISVRDNGIGIPEDNLSALFDMFRRGQTAHNKPGSGMGLALSKRIVENHGGRIWISSAPGQGCNITLALPTEVVDPSKTGKETLES